ncbi:MAG: imidazoleglycerol-phosphate dehydratase HisB [Selenomonadaceae bacterium]|nr:imidazoleglycerol-phosphate dehydratase HisB [Selenomonadaceae bacterium]MDD7056239.1 imidazoleglycerol-phosphate dehydratase HisB [Selenomonadaceae bacterium]MDY3915582.1 imidazoleglycerol-phosphate dehydratase HisB [Selenomonadaceae bacterium]
MGDVLKKRERKAEVTRETGETKVSVWLNLDGTGQAKIDSGIGFFDHMLNLMAVHGLLDLELACDGDLEVDGHHSVEDIGITLGQAFKEALGDKSGIRRYASFYLPMDETLALVALDISGRPFLVYDGGEMAPMIGGYDTELTEEFLRAFAFNAGVTLHVKVLYGTNSHHKVEAIFKALGHVLRNATESDPRVSGIPSTKGML